MSNPLILRPYFCRGGKENGGCYRRKTFIYICQAFRKYASEPFINHLREREAREFSSYDQCSGRYFQERHIQRSERTAVKLAKNQPSLKLKKMQ